MNTEIKNYMMEQLEKLMNIPSPTGYTKNAQVYLVAELENLGF